jgi:hypothetical protein
VGFRQVEHRIAREDVLEVEQSGNPPAVRCRENEHVAVMAVVVAEGRARAAHE